MVRVGELGGVPLVSFAEDPGAGPASEVGGEDGVAGAVEVDDEVGPDVEGVGRAWVWVVVDDSMLVVGLVGVVVDEAGGTEETVGPVGVVPVVFVVLVGVVVVVLEELDVVVVMVVEDVLRVVPGQCS